MTTSTLIVILRALELLATLGVIGCILIVLASVVVELRSHDHDPRTWRHRFRGRGPDPYE
jgi:hypothetical protein